MALTGQRHIRSSSVPSALWTNWEWQRNNALRTPEDFKQAFPLMDEAVSDLIRRSSTGRRIAATPYFLSLVEAAYEDAPPHRNNPLWAQLLPAYEINTDGVAVHPQPIIDKWHKSSEAISAIATRRFENRIIVRVANVCFSYCQFCFEASRTLDKRSAKPSLSGESWGETVDYLKVNREIDEVILSGGEPLMLSNKKLEEILSDLRQNRPDINIRIHTRAMTFNPFRFDAELLDILLRYRVNSIGLNVTHRFEISETFCEILSSVQRFVPVVFSMTPLLKSINDSDDEILMLVRRLYNLGVRPYALYHFMPHSPGERHYRTSVSQGIEILRELRQKLSRLALPGFILSHPHGKVTVPLDGNTENFDLQFDADGIERITFRTASGHQVRYC